MALCSCSYYYCNFYKDKRAKRSDTVPDKSSLVLVAEIRVGDIGLVGESIGVTNLLSFGSLGSGVGSLALLDVAAHEEDSSEQSNTDEEDVNCNVCDPGWDVSWAVLGLRVSAGGSVHSLGRLGDR